MSNKNIRYGLALSGGGARGLMHLGVLQAMNDRNFYPAAISGTSMGAIVAAFYAMGIEPYDVLNIIKDRSNQIKAIKIRMKHRKATGLFKIALLEKNLIKFAPADDFAALKIPIYISVSNLTTGKNEIHSKGKFIDYVIASASIPILFETRQINGHHYVDGGLTKNMAVQVLTEKTDKIIGVHSNYISENHEIKNIKDVAERCFQLSIFNTVKNELSYCDYLIDPPEVRQFSTFDFLKAERIFEIGYREGLKFLENLEKEQL
jgi:NTE family protein